LNYVAKVENKTEELGEDTYWKPKLKQEYFKWTEHDWVQNKTRLNRKKNTSDRPLSTRAEKIRGYYNDRNEEPDVEVNLDETENVKEEEKPNLMATSEIEKNLDAYQGDYFMDIDNLGGDDELVDLGSSRTERQIVALTK
jgi:hypothetical protein